MKRFFKILVSIAIILFFGFYGIIFFFADLGPGETMMGRLIIAFVYYFVFGLLLCKLMYPRTRFAFFLLWGVIAVALLNLPQILRESGRSIREAVEMIGAPGLGVFLAGEVVKYLKKQSRKKGK